MLACRAADAPRRRTVRARGEPRRRAGRSRGGAVDEDLRGRRLSTAVAPARAVPIHQAIINPNARGIYYGRLTEMTNTDFQCSRRKPAPNSDSRPPVF